MRTFKIKVWMSNKHWIEIHTMFQPYHEFIREGYIIRDGDDDDTPPTQDEINMAFQFAANSGEKV